MYRRNALKHNAKIKSILFSKSNTIKNEIEISTERPKSQTVEKPALTRDASLSFAEIRKDILGKSNVMIQTIVVPKTKK